MPNNAYAGYAVVLPNQTPSTFEVMQQLQHQNELHRLQRERDQKEEQARQNSLVQYMGQNFDPKDFDGLLGQQLSQKREQYAKMIHDNPNMSMADLTMLMQKDMGNLSQWNQSIKEGRDAIKAQADSYKKIQGIDAEGAEKAALNNFVYKRDANGQMVLKSPDELQDPTGAVQKEIYGNPKLFRTQDGDVWDDLKSTQVTNDGKSYTVPNSLGGHTKRQYDFSFYQPYQTIQHEKGKDPVIVPRQQQAVGADGKPIYTTDASGKKSPYMIADEEGYAHYKSNLPRKLDLIQKVKDQGLDPDSPGGQIMMRRLALEDYRNIGAVKHNINDVETQKNNITINNGANGANIHDAYADVKKFGSRGIDATRVNELPMSTASALLKHAQEQIGKIGADPSIASSGRNITNNDIWVRNNPDGTYTLMLAKEPGKPNKVNDTEISPITYDDLNENKAVHNTTKAEKQTVRANAAKMEQPEPQQSQVEGRKIKGRSGKTIIIPQ